jgi:hypothetical protein
MTSTALVPMDSLERMAQAVANSKLFGVTNPEQALALMLVAQAEGLHPATAARDYHIIQGRPSLKADAMLARYLNSGGKVEWHDHTDAKVAATFSHPAGGTLKIEWDIERARKAGLDGKDMWKKYPRQMLRARVISEGIRATNPAVASGIYTPEEVMDMEPDRKRKEKDVTPPKDPAPELKDVLEAIKKMTTKAERTAAKALADKLEDADFIQQAEAAWAERIEELKKPSSTAPVATGEV